MAAPDPASTEWVPIWSPQGVITGGGGGGLTPHHLTHEPGGSDAIVNLSGAVITTGTVADARLSANVALKNAENVFTADQRISRAVPIITIVDTASPVDSRVFRLLQFGQSFHIDAVNDAGDVRTGIVSINRSGVVTALSGLGATPLNASQLTTGTVAVPRLPSNIVYTDNQQTITAGKVFTGVVHLFGPAQSPTIQGFTPAVNFWENAGAVNQHYTRFVMNGGTLQLQTMNDAYDTVLATLFQVDRSGIAYGNGAGMTNLNGSHIATGTVYQARLGAGAFNSSTFLRGDGVWAASAGIPSGLIAMFNTSCPTGWSRVAGLDGRFPRGATSWGATGGASSHTHGVGGNTNGGGGHSHSFAGSGGFSGRTTTENVTTPIDVNRSGPTALLFLPHDHGFSGSVDISGNTGSVGDHSHSLNGSTTDVSHLPPYVDVVYCIKD